MTDKSLTFIADIPATDAYIAQHHRDSATLRELCAERDLEKSRADSLSRQVAHDYEQIAKLVAERDQYLGALRLAVLALAHASEKDAVFIPAYERVLEVLKDAPVGRAEALK